MNDVEIKCPGCGVTIQTITKDKPGYINKDVLEKHKDDFLCERCFKLKHYNEITNEEVEIDFPMIFKEISKKNNLIVEVIDCFDLLGSVISNINELFPKSDVLIIANKYDLFLRSNRPTKIRTYLKKYLKNLEINFCDVIVTSSIDNKASKPIYELIKKYADGREIYFVGITNVGKSTLLNTISKIDEQELSLTTSNQVGTTLDITKYKMFDLVFGDTPGYYNKKQATYYLDKKSLNLTIPKKYIKPRIYQLYSDDTIFINGYGYITYIGKEKCGMGFYVSNSLMLYRTKNNPQEYYTKHLEDLLVVPNKMEKSRMGKMITKEMHINSGEELAISGIGFISFSIECNIRITIYENIEIKKRVKLI